jgi:hypothetical protein
VEGLEQRILELEARIVARLDSLPSAAGPATDEPS